MDGLHESTNSAGRCELEENVADKLCREVQLLSSGIVGGALKEAKRDPSATAVKAAAAVGTGLALGTAAAAASPWIAGAAVACGVVGTGAWAWSTFNTLDESNRKRNAMIASAVRSAWDCNDYARLRKNESVMQKALGKDSLDAGLGLISGIGAGAGMKYIPLSVCKLAPKVGFEFFSQAAITRAFPKQASEFKILHGVESLGRLSQGESHGAQLRVREILGYDKNGIPRLDRERQLLLAHNGKGTSITADSVAAADLLACCDPQLLSPALRAKSVLQQSGRLWVDTDGTTSTLKVWSERRYGEQLYNQRRTDGAFSLCSEKPLAASEEVLGVGLPESAREPLIVAARTIHAAETQFGKQTPGRQEVDALRNAYDVVIRRIGQTRAVPKENIGNQEFAELNQFKVSCFESMFKLYMESPFQFHDSSGHQRCNSSTNVTERSTANVFCDLLDKGRLKIEIPRRMVIWDGLAVQFRQALKQRLPEILTEGDFDAYIDPRNWKIIHEKGTAADDAKADILLCNKATGHYFAFDVTERTDASGVFQTNVALSGNKCYVSTDRRPFIIASSDNNRPFWASLLAGKADKTRAERLEQEMLSFLEQCIVSRNPFHIMRHVLPYAEKGSKQAIEQLQSFQEAITRGWPAWADELTGSIRYLQHVQRRANGAAASHHLSWLPELEITDDPRIAESMVA